MNHGAQQPRVVSVSFKSWVFRLLPALSVLVLVAFGVLWAQTASAATMSISPSAGTFTTGSTFDVSILLNTEGEEVNTIRAFLTFPTDKLQVVPQTAGQSIIGIYTLPPRFDNSAGIIDLRGGIPGGINVSSGLVIRLTFRVRSVGTAVIRFGDQSTVLANDGQGTNILERTDNGVYSLVLPAPAGPVVVSETHPDQSMWYSARSASFSWSADVPGVEGYSYVLNELPTYVPDNISEGLRTSVVYQDLQEGTLFFHIKSRRQDVWGGTTHFAINVDSSPPAAFPVEIIPSARTSSRKPVLQFATTDALSGLDHYELRMIPLHPDLAVASTDGSVLGFQPIFIEVTSPYVAPELELGNYDVVVRAYDKVGNFRDVSERLRIVTPFFKVVSGQGVQVSGLFVLPWVWVWVLSAILTGLLGFLAWRIALWHREVEGKHVKKKPSKRVRKKLEELEKFRKKYGHLALLLFLVASLLLPVSVLAQEEVSQLPPPFISTVSRNITNEEIFYVGGKTDTGGKDVIIYLQNLQSGQTTSYIVTSDAKGEWFYRHSTFLPTGKHLLWTQSRVADELSPPSPQVELSVNATAIQFGASRISKEFLYFILTLALFLLSLGLAVYIIYHAVHGRRKHRLVMKEVQEAEQSVTEGFTKLREDIQEELAALKKGRRRLSAADKEQEKALLADLKAVEQHIGEEVVDIEKAEQAG